MMSKYKILQPNRLVRLLPYNVHGTTRKAGLKNPAFFVPFFDVA